MTQESEPDTAEEISETHTHILDLRDKFYERIKPQPSENGYGGMRLPYACILEAHLLELTEAKHNLKDELEELIRKNIIRSFEIEIPEYLPERFFVLTVDYVHQLESLKKPLVDKFVKEVVNQSVSPRVSKSWLAKAGFSEAEMRELVDLKCLLIKSANVYQMSMPFCGAMKSSLASGRRYLVNYLSGKPGKTYDKSEIERRTIDDSIFYAEFHMHELIGLGVFQVVKTPARADRIRLIFDPYKK